MTSKKAQSTIEYAIIISVVVAALVAIHIYMKRGIAGRLRSSADEIGGQYSPGITTSSFTVTTTGTTDEITTLVTDESGNALGLTTTQNTNITQISSPEGKSSETVPKFSEETWL